MSSVTFNDWWNVKQEENMTTVKTAEKICTSCLLPSACEGGEEEEEEEGRAASDDFCRKTKIGNKVRRGGKPADRNREMLRNNRKCNSTQNKA